MCIIQHRRFNKFNIFLFRAQTIDNKRVPGNNDIFVFSDKNTHNELNKFIRAIAKDNIARLHTKL